MALAWGCADEGQTGGRGIDPTLIFGKGDGPNGACPGFADPVELGAIEGDAFEVSGVVASRSQPGVFFAVNDKGSAPVVFAFDRFGNALGAFALVGASNRDWEDIALGPGPSPDGVDYLYVADTGDNARTRESARIYRFPEPTVGTEDAGAVDIYGVEDLEIVYEDGVARNSEALLVDPLDGTAFVISRARGRKEHTEVFRAVWPEVPGAVGRLELVLSDEDAVVLSGEVVAADVSADGSVIALAFDDALSRVWVRRPEQSIPEALSNTPCPGPSGGANSRALALRGDGMAGLMVPEGVEAPVLGVELAFACPEAAVAADVTRDGAWLALVFKNEEVRLWHRRDDQALWEVLQQTPCSVPVALGQVETVAFTLDGSALFMVPEGAEPTLTRTPLH